MAEAVVSFVIERLGDSAIQEGKFLFGVGNQVKLAQRELRLMHAFLRDADVRQRDEETVRIWVAEIRDAAYDLEDVIEVYAFKVTLKRRRGFKYAVKGFACILNRGVHLHRIGSEIQSITTKLTDLSSSMEKFNFKETRQIGDATSAQQKLRRTYSHVIERDVVGLEDDVNQVAMHLLKDDTNSHQVVSIWGMGGSGKTTLAKQVYHHKNVVSHFDCAAWMCISQQFNIREVWENILVKLLSPTNDERIEIEKMKDDEIAKKLYLLQQERRCLVVLDDVWRIETLNSLKAAFPWNNESKSSMLLTTRNREVALYVNKKVVLYQPRPLSDDESWELLEKVAMIGRDEIDLKIYSKMKNLGKRMLQYCAGLPLAITVLGGLLARKDTINDWETVLKNVRIFISRGKSHEMEYEGATPVLELSYDDLPYHLKPCFLYLGQFPEDSEIGVKMLTQLWIAEGFISTANQRQDSVETLEEVAYHWLSVLVERCLVQVGEQGTIRKIKSCRLHDLVRDMCLSKANEENFLQVISLQKNEASASMETKVTNKVRRLTVHVAYVDNNLVPPSKMDGCLRSLLYFGSMEWRSQNIRLLQSMLKDLKLLRVLKLERVGGRRWTVELPSAFGKMVHLRYLSLVDSRINRLSSSMANLTCLKTLDLREAWIWEGPNVVGKMKQLRHLYFPSLHHIGKQQVSNLGNLQTLEINSYDFEWNDLAKLTSLTKLTLHISIPLKNIEQVLKSESTTLNRLRSLSVYNYLPIFNSAQMQIYLSCRNIYKLKLHCVRVELPQDPHYYTNLAKLHLTSCYLKDDQIAVLEKLPNLTKVTLDKVSVEGKRELVVISEGGFPHLQVLTFNLIEKLENWEVKKGGMPNLRELSIYFCKNLRRLPEGLRYVTTLQKINIRGMHITDCNRLQEGGEDFYKVQHVSSLVFQNIR